MARENKEWAPCAHTDEERVAAGEWLRGVLANDAFDVPENPNIVEESESSALEHLLWIVGLDAYTDGPPPFRNVHFGFVADQWVGVSLDLVYADGTSEHLWTEGDTFTLALAKTVERLKAKAAAWQARARDDTTGA